MSEDEFWDMLPREFYRRLEAYRRRMEQQAEMTWRHVTLPVLNHLRDVMNVLISAHGGKKRVKYLTPSDVGLPEPEGDAERRGPMSREAYEEMKAHFRYLREHGTRTLLN